MFTNIFTIKQHTHKISFPDVFTQYYVQKQCHSDSLGKKISAIDKESPRPKNTCKLNQVSLVTLFAAHQNDWLQLCGIGLAWMASHCQKISGEKLWTGTSQETDNKPQRL